MSASTLDQVLGGPGRASYEALSEDARELVERAIVAALPILREDPTQVAGQLWGRLCDLELADLREFLGVLVSQARGGLLPRTRSLASPSSPLIDELSGHTAAVSALLFLPNGRLLSASEDGSLRLWNLARGSVRVLAGHPGPINALARSRDGTYFATGSDKRTVALWTVKGPKKLAVFEGHSGPVRDLGFTRAGALVSASADGSLRVWTVPDGESRIVARYPREITAMAVSPVEALAAVATMDNTLRLVELDSGNERVLHDCSGNFLGTVMGAALGVANKSEIGHENFAKALCFSPDGQTVYSAEDSLIAWDVAEGDQRRRWRGHSWPIEDLASLDDGSLVATAAESVMLWKVGGGEPPSRLTGHPEGGHSLAFSPDGEALVVGYEDGRIKRWDRSRPTSLASTPGHLRNVWSLALSPDGGVLASGGADKCAILWDIATARELARIDDFADLFVHALGWSPDGRRLYASSGPDLLEWDIDSSTLVRTRRWLGSPRVSARFLVCLGDGRVLVAGYGSGLSCWPGDGEPASHWSGLRKDRNTTGFVLGPGEAVFQAVYHDAAELPGKVHRWDPSRAEITQVLETPGEYVSELELSDSGRFLIGGGSAGGVYVWDAESGALVHELERHPHRVTNLVALAGDRLLSAASEGPVCEWDLERGSLRRRLGPLERCDNLCVSRDGTRLAARRKQAVGLFDLEAEAWLGWFTADGPVDHVRLSPDGATVIVGERSGTLSMLGVLDC